MRKSQKIPRAQRIPSKFRLKNVEEGRNKKRETTDRHKGKVTCTSGAEEDRIIKGRNEYVANNLHPKQRGNIQKRQVSEDCLVYVQEPKSSIVYL